MYFVYIIYSEIAQKYYTGSTENFESRILHHNGGYNRSTKTGIPWKLVQLFQVENKTLALQLEFKIKKRGAKRYLLDINCTIA